MAAKRGTQQRTRVELVTSPSAARLMGETVRRVLELCDAGERVALVAPTTRLLDAFQRALLAARRPAGAAAGAHVLHHRSLATHVLGRAYLHGLRDAPPPRLLGALEAETLVRAAVHALPSASPLRQLCDDRPRFVASLQRTLGELREALVTPAALRKELGAKHDLVRLHEAHDDLLARVALERHAVDAAGHATQAAGAAASLARAGLLPWTRVVHHGAQELVGAQAALVDALASALPTLVLAPCGDGPAHATARRGLARWPGERAAATRLDEPHAAPTLVDTEALCDEDASVAAGTLRLPERAVVDAFHVRGTRAEVELAARLCAEAHLERGVPLEDLAVVARSLEPYAAHLEEAFAAHGVPFTTSATSPLLREPWARAAATLLDALAEDLPRPLVAELLRSPWASLDDKAPPGDVVPDLWDEWSLAARVVRGADAWRDDVLAWHAADLRALELRNDATPGSLDDTSRARTREARIRALGAVVSRLDGDRAAWAACTTHGAHATTLREILSRWLRVPEEGGAAARARRQVLAVLDDLALLDGLAPGPAPALSAVRALVRDALASASLPMGSQDGAGVRVLSAMPARAVPFREVVLVGLTQGAFPRRPRHDPFLPDDVRQRLRSSAPALGVKREARDEERQLLALVLGAATGAVHVAWQRADDDGGVRAPSLFLREIARVTVGRADLDALVARRPGDARLDGALPLLAVPGHPALAAAALRARFRRTTWRDALLEAAERPQRRLAVDRLAEATGRMRAGLPESLRAIGVLDAFEVAAAEPDRAAQLAHDGLLGEGVGPPEVVSASALQAFGRCALQWLFSRGFGIPQREEEPDPLSVGADELGTCVHAVLEAVNRHAIEAGGAPEHLATPQALDLARRRWEAGVAELARGRVARAPLAWEVLSTAWLGTIERFLQQDAERLDAEDARIVAAEGALDAVVDVGGERLPLRGRVDRIVRLREGWQVEDYKTSPKVDRHVEKRDVLKGLSLQGLAYALMLRRWAEGREHPAGRAAWTRAAFIPVHPGASSMAPQVLEVDDLEASWTETLAVLVRAWRDGAFAPRRAGHCAWCDFRAACRRDHGPTRARLRQVAEWGDYLLLSHKATRPKEAQLLAGLRGLADAGEDA